MEQSNNHYYVPPYSKLPFFGALGIFLLGFGSLSLLHANLTATLIFMAGALVLAGVLFGWFREVIREQSAGLYTAQITHSFRWAMLWFIFTEIFLFGIFLSAVFYARLISLPALAGEGSSRNLLTHLILWPNFNFAWPSLTNPNPVAFPGATGTMSIWDIPVFNSIVIFLSAITVTFAYRFLIRDARNLAILSLLVTIVLGLLFVNLQAQELLLSISQYGLTLNSGIYASSFFMLVGLHLAHVIIGLIMLIVMLIRTVKGHFTKDENFAFKATVWFWQFITVVWLVIFVFVY